MKPFIFAFLLFAMFGVQTAAFGEWSDAADKSITLSELSKAPGTTVKIETLPKADDVPAIPGLPQPDFAHPIQEVTILFFPGATLFSPDFFKNFRGYFFPDPEHPSTIFPSGLKLYLVVRSADHTELARVPLVYDIVSDADSTHTHFKIKFLITAETMKNSYLLIVEVAPRNGTEFPTTVYLGGADTKK